MCGRFTIKTDEEGLKKRFQVDFGFATYHPVFNAAPGMNLPVIETGNPRMGRLFKWGLIPSWAKDAKIGFKTINARAETLLEKPSFRNLIARKRCAIPADQYYEWKKEGKVKIPYAIGLKNKSPFVMAGLYDSWKSPEGTVINSFTIITTKSNELTASVHERMPVILNEQEFSFWMEPEVRPSDIMDILHPYPSDEMHLFRVSTLINTVANQQAEVAEPLALSK